MFIASELVAYIILFRDFYIYTERLRKSKTLGLKEEILNDRKRKNIINFAGQFVTFIIEIFAATVAQFVILYHGNNSFNDIALTLSMFGTALSTLTFFLASPELKRFYLRK